MFPDGLTCFAHKHQTDQAQEAQAQMLKQQKEYEQQIADLKARA